MSTEITAPVTQEAPSATPAPAIDPQTDTRLAALARKEREIQQQMAAFKQEKSGMISKTDLANLWKTDRAKLREYVGANPEEWKFGDPTPEAPIDPVMSLRQEIEAMKQSAAEKQQAEATRQFKQGIVEFISQAPDEYELISANDAHDTVFEFMVDYYKDNGTELTFQEACDYVENYIDQQANKLAQTKKFRSKFQTSQEPGKQPSPTLTGAAAANPVPSTQRKMTPEESLAEAAKLIKWI